MLYKYRYWLGSGIFLSVSLLHPFLWWGVVCGVALLLFGIRASQSLQETWLGTLFVGTAKGLAGFAGIWYTYPLLWLGLEPGALQIALIGLFWAAHAVVIGLGFSVAGVLYWYATKHDARAWYFFPFFFVGGEVLGSLLFSVFALGPGAYLNVYMSLGYAGYPLMTAGNIFSAFAFVGGVYAMSWAVALMAVFAYGYYERPHARRHILMVGVVLLAALLVSSHATLNREYAPGGYRVIAVDTEITTNALMTDEGSFNKKTVLKEAVGEALTYEPDVIVLPEDSRFVQQFGHVESLFSFLTEQGRDVVLIDSGRVEDARGETVLRAFIVDTAASSVYVVDKQYFTPQGEYVPYWAAFVLSTLGYADILEGMYRNQSYRPGMYTDYQFVPPSIPGVLFCFESVSPLGVMNIQKETGYPFVVHPVSHGWFTNPTPLWYQLDMSLRIQAVWNRVPIVTATNRSTSAIYYPDGRRDQGIYRGGSTDWSLYEYNL